VKGTIGFQCQITGRGHSKKAKGVRSNFKRVEGKPWQNQVKRERGGSKREKNYIKPPRTTQKGRRKKAGSKETKTRVEETLSVRELYLLLEPHRRNLPVGMTNAEVIPVNASEKKKPRGTVKDLCPRKGKRIED